MSEEIEWLNTMLNKFIESDKKESINGEITQYITNNELNDTIKDSDTFKNYLKTESKYDEFINTVLKDDTDDRKKVDLFLQLVPVSLSSVLEVVKDEINYEKIKDIEFLNMFKNIEDDKPLNEELIQEIGNKLGLNPETIEEMKKVNNPSRNSKKSGNDENTEKSLKDAMNIAQREKYNAIRLLNKMVQKQKELQVKKEYKEMSIECLRQSLEKATNDVGAARGKVTEAETAETAATEQYNKFIKEPVMGGKRRHTTTRHRKRKHTKKTRPKKRRPTKKMIPKKMRRPTKRR